MPIPVCTLELTEVSKAEQTMLTAGITSDGGVKISHLLTDQ